MNRRPLMLLTALLGLGFALWLLNFPGEAGQGPALGPELPGATSNLPLRADGAAGSPRDAAELEGGPVGVERTEALADADEQGPDEEGPCSCKLTFVPPPDATLQERESLVGRTVQLCEKYHLSTESAEYKHLDVKIQPDLTAHFSGLWGGEYALRQALPMDSVSGSSPMCLAPFVAVGPVGIDFRGRPSDEAQVQLVRGRRFAGTIVDESGRPRGGVTISLFVEFPEVLYAADEIIQTASRADGTFAFQCLPKRPTRLSMRSPDGASRRVRGRRLRELLSASDPVTLSLPSLVQRRFRLLLPDGRAAAGFPLNVLQVDTAGVDWTRLITDEAGMAAIDECAPGDLVLSGVALGPEVIPPGTEPVVLSEKLLTYGDATVPEGQTKWFIDERLSSAALGGKGPIELMLVKAPTLTGRLTGLSLTERARVWIYLIKPERYEANLSPWEFGARRTEIAEVAWKPGRASTLYSQGEGQRSDGADGTVRFRLGCAAGNYYAVATTKNPQSVTNIVLVTVGEDDADIVLSFPEPGRLEGLLQGPDGAPIPNATVRAIRTPLAPSWLSSEELKARTTADGRFEITPVPPATYRMEVSADGGLFEENSEVSVVEGSTTTWNAKLKPAGRLLVQLPDGVEFQEHLVDLAGPDGARLKAESRQLTMGGSIVEFPSVPSGQVTALARIGPDGEWYSGRSWVASGSTAEVRLLPGYGQEAHVEGFVYVDDQPARGYHVSLQDEQMQHESFATDARGHYSVADVPAGAYLMRVIPPDYGSHVFEQKVEARPGKNSLGPIVLEAGSIRGYFSVSSRSFYEERIQVVLRHADAADDSDPLRVAGASLGGEFIFLNVPGGRYRVHCLRDGREWRDVHGPIVAPVTIDLLRGHSLEDIELDVRIPD